MFDLTQISRYRENNQLEAKLATGGLPKSIWETYSAFANSYGGVILLGVEELCDRSLRVQGLLDPRELVDEFKTMLDDRRVVSANLLREEDIRILSLDGRAIVVIQVPPHPGTSCPSISEEIRVRRLLPPQRRRRLSLHPRRAQRHALRAVPLSTAAETPPLLPAFRNSGLISSPSAALRAAQTVIKPEQSWTTGRKIV